jgi:hypothetical protein
VEPDTLSGLSVPVVTPLDRRLVTPPVREPGVVMTELVVTVPCVAGGVRLTGTLIDSGTGPTPPPWLVVRVAELSGYDADVEAVELVSWLPAAGPLLWLATLVE